MKRILKINRFTQAHLIKLRYDPQTGDIIGAKGFPVGVVYKTGYVVVSVRRHGVVYREYAHRLAFMLQGLPAPEVVDHIDGVKTNNRWNNLRAANKSINALNVNAPRADNTTGRKGVYINRKTGSFVASIRINGRNKYLGSFPTADEAHAAYCAAKAQILEAACQK